MADTGGLEGIILPSLFPKPGEVLEHSLARRQQNDQFNRQLTERAAERTDRHKEQDDWRKAGMIDKKSDPSKYHTGFEQFDGWVDKKAEEIVDQFTNDPKYRGMDIATYAGELNKAWMPIVNGYGLVKGKMNRELESVNNATAQNKWVDKDKLVGDVYNHIAHDYFHTDENGAMTFKPPDKINPNISYTDELLNSPDAYKYANDASIDDFQKNIVSAKEEKRDYILKDGADNTMHYKGGLSPFERENVTADAKGFVKKPPSYTIATEGRTDQSGNPINTLPQDTIDAYMTNTPSRKMAFQRQFHEYAYKSGIDVSKLTPKELQVKQQEFAHTAVKGLRNNQPDLFAYNRAPQIHVSTGKTESEKNPAAAWVADMHEAATKGDAEAIKKVGSQLFAGNATGKRFKGAELKDGNVYLSWEEDDKDAYGNAEVKNHVYKIPSVAGNEYSKPELAGFWQKIAGSTQPIENKLYYKGGDAPKTKATGKKKIANF